MIKKLDFSQDDLIGFEIQGKLTKEEYIHHIKSTFDRLRKTGQKVRFLLYFGPEFLGFTAGAAWEDFKLGMKYLRTVERLAVVTDIEWVRNSSYFFGSLLPAPVRVYKNAELSEAIAWLASNDTSLEHYLDERRGVLTVKITGPLTSENFDALTHYVDTWVEKRGELRGLILQVKEFPGWENFGSFLKHIEFIRGHHRKIARVALASDGVFPNIITKLGQHFIEAEIKNYKYDQLRRAQAWAGERIKYTVDAASK